MGFTKDIWAELDGFFQHSGKIIKVIHGNLETGKNECRELHIPTDSALGAIVLHTNGIIVDNWIRIFGQDSYSNNGVAHYNRKNRYLDKISGLFLVAGDVLGGIFAINLTRFSVGKNMIWYFAPDTLVWECLEMMYSEFLAWSLQGNTNDFYSTMRWQGWKNDVRNIAFNSAILVYPFLWAHECNLEIAGKKAVALDEIIEMNFRNSDILNA